MGRFSWLYCLLLLLVLPKNYSKMVKLFPVKSFINISNEKRNSKNRSIRSTGSWEKRHSKGTHGPEDCTKKFGKCSCLECCKSPVVVISAGEQVCHQHEMRLRNVKNLTEGGVLELYDEECFMIYCQISENGFSQVGLFAALDVEDCKNNVIKKHENVTTGSDETCPKLSKLDRNPYVNPVMLMYRENPVVTEIINRVIATEAPQQLCGENLPDFMVEESARYQTKNSKQLLWKITDPSDISAVNQAFAPMDSLYIADGHHRTAAAICRGHKRKCASSKYITALIYADTQLNVLSYNRCVQSSDVMGKSFDPIHFMDEVTKVFRVTQRNESPASSSPESNTKTVFDKLMANEGKDDEHIISMYLDNRWYDLVRLGDNEFKPEDPLSSIDAQVLLELLLKPVFQVDEPDSPNRMIYVDGRQGPEGVSQLIDNGEALVGFCVRPVSTQEIMQIADADQLLPPKATYFDPKPLPGLLLRLKI